MSLVHRWVAAEGARPTRFVLMLHGFLGQGRNWESVARRLVERMPECAVVLPDLRMHGGSQPLVGPHDIPACAVDLSALSDALGVPFDVVMGHSFGGKVALEWSKSQQSLSQVWVLDSTPRVVSERGSAYDMLGRIAAVPRLESRAEVVAALVAGGLGHAEAHWVATNLERGPHGLRWRLDLDALRAMILDFYARDLWEVAEAPAHGQTLHVVRATRSDVLSADDLTRLRAAGARTGRVHVHELDSGHWVNVGDPEGLLALFVAYL